MSSLRVMDEADCRHRLEDATLGRLGFASRSLPVVLPVNYVVDGDRLLFATESSSIVAAAINGSVACLEIDDHDGMSHSGWSVLVTGQLREVDDDDALDVQRHRPLPMWRAMPAPHLISLSMDMISGRRLAAVGAGDGPGGRR